MAGFGVLQNNWTTQQLFIGGNLLYKTGTYTNSGGSPVTLAMGTLVGQVLATGKILPLVAAATDGSQYPRGVLQQSYTVAAGASVTVSYCFSGMVNQNMLILNGSETLDTTVASATTGGGSIGALITSLTTITLWASNELSKYDNAVS